MKIADLHDDVIPALDAGIYTFFSRSQCLGTGMTEKVVVGMTEKVVVGMTEKGAT